MSATRSRSVPTTPGDRSASSAHASSRSPASRRSTPLRRITRMLEIPRGRLLAAIAAATATLASAFALAATSAWLITTAWTMPPVLDLSVAVVSVRALGISRGVFRWVDRMATHDAALRGVVSLRTRLFAALAARGDDALLRLRRGDLLARLGDDAQEIGDHVIRAVVPIAAAGVMAIAAVVLIAPISPLAALAMLASLAIASLAAPLLAYRAARITEHAVVTTRGEVTSTALEILDDGPSLRLQGRLDAALAEEVSAQARHDAAIDRAALPAALAAAAVPGAMILAVLGSVLAAGPLWTSGAASAGAIGVLLLLPLSSFEAASALPQAAAQVARSRAAAARLDAAIGAGDGTSARTRRRTEDVSEGAEGHEGANDLANLGGATPELLARGLTAGWRADAPVVAGLDLALSPGSRLAVLGPSGSGKSTLLLTLAGLLDPLGGQVRLGGHDVQALDEAAVRDHVVMYAEDAHVFATTVRENLRVARGDATDAEVTAALAATGLGEWIEGLPGGLDHHLGPAGTTVSGGERRRLLLARALLRRSPITLLDEPTEHLDAARASHLLRGLLTTGEEALLPSASTVVVVTHQEDAIPAGTAVLRLDGAGGAALGRAASAGVRGATGAAGIASDPASGPRSEPRDEEDR